MVAEWECNGYGNDGILHEKSCSSLIISVVERDPLLPEPPTTTSRFSMQKEIVKRINNLTVFRNYKDI